MFLEAMNVPRQPPRHLPAMNCIGVDHIHHVHNRDHNHDLFVEMNNSDEIHLSHDEVENILV